MPETADTVGQRLDEIRRREGLSQVQFSEALGISRSSLQNYVRGERDLPLAILSILLEKFGIDPVWMMYGDKSDVALRRQSEFVAEIRKIGLSLDTRAEERGINLTKEDRWRMVSLIYTALSLQDVSLNRERTNRDFVVDSMLGNHGNA